MFHKVAKTAAAFMLTSALSLPAYADLSGTLRIMSDMSNPAPRAIMESLASGFDALHPNLKVELEVVDHSNIYFGNFWKLWSHQYSSRDLRSFSIIFH